MKCPDCGEQLSKIGYMQNEYVCHNLDCPANIKLKKELNCPALKEYYGKTQKEINKQKLLN